jgi:glycosyltransferase involved in cell wall biosynthesis
MPKVSIIIPVYNVEKYLRKCIDSVLNQTYKDIEVILVDDGSLDKCPQICDEYLKRDARVKVIHKKNGGLSDARNVGVKYAQGDYIGFVDSDDYVSTQMVELLYSSITKEEADIVMGNYIHVDETGNSIDEKISFQIEKQITYSRDEFVDEVIKKTGGYYVVACSKLYKKEIFEKISFPLGKQHEDEFVFHYVVGMSKKIVCISDVIYFYLQRDDSIMGKKFNEKRIDYGEALIDRYYYTKKMKQKKWRENTVQKLTYELEKWKKYGKTDRKVNERYNQVRKKSMFLIFEGKAWNYGIYNWKGRLYMKLMFLLNR